MFAKLLKYDFKANAGLLGLLAACALGVGCISAVILRLLTTQWDQIAARDESFLVIIPAVLFLFFAYVSVIVYCVASQYILLFRFYKSRFTDEGYLTFTLPVKTHHIFLSGGVNMLIWSAISIIVTFTSVSIAIGLGPAWTGETLAEFQLVLEEMKVAFSEIITPGFGFLSILYMLVAWIYGAVMPLSAVVLGATVAKKHKVLAIIGILIGISMITSMISGLITGVTQLLLITAEDLSLYMTLMPLLSCFFLLVMIVGGYFLSVSLMKKKLNLP